MPNNAVTVRAGWSADGSRTDRLNVEITLTKERVLEAIEGGLPVIHENPPVFTTLDFEALKAIFAAAGEGDITIAVIETEDFIYDVTVTGNGTKVTNFAPGHITIAVPYDLEPGASPDAVVMYSIRDNGTQELLRCMFDRGYAVFIAQNVSKFTIKQENITFSDRAVTETWALGHITFVAVRGLFVGNLDGTFRPRGHITYAELAAVLANYDGQVFPPGSFPAAHINWAENNGIFKGVTYQANRSATRAHMALMIHNYIQTSGMFVDTFRSFSFNDIAASGTDAANAIIALANAGIVSGDRGNNGPFRPAANITRAEVAAIIANLVKAFNY
jgi:hypothetical protein